MASDVKILRRLLLIAVLPVFLAVLPCCAETAAEAPESKTADWTVMFYFCGSDLESSEKPVATIEFE